MDIGDIRALWQVEPLDRLQPVAGPQPESGDTASQTSQVAAATTTQRRP